MRGREEEIWKGRRGGSQRGAGREVERKINGREEGVVRGIERSLSVKRGRESLSEEAFDACQPLDQISLS